MTVPAADQGTATRHQGSVIDRKGSADPSRMLPSSFGIYARLCGRIYARLCGRLLARAHARPGDWIAIASYLCRGEAFDRAVASFADVNADQNERDYQAHVTAVKTGRLTPHLGV